MLTEGSADQLSTDKESPSSVAYWVNEIGIYERESRAWHERAKKIIRRYTDERSPREDSLSRLNILWSNTQTLMPALYARNPKPDISRRFNDADPVARTAGDVLERCAAFFCSRDDFGHSARQAVLDYLLPGRGTLWVRYVPHFAQGQDDSQSEEGASISDDVDTDQDEAKVLQFEEVAFDYVHWSDFGHTIGRTWQEVKAVWRRVYLDEKELKARFGEAAEGVPLDHKTKGAGDSNIANAVAKATIYEVWCATDKTVYWLHKDKPEFLDHKPDFLGVEGFYPCPRPLFANLSNESLIPIPDYVQYQDQANQLDDLTSRIASMTKALKVAGVYDASAEGIGRLLAEGVENQLIPVDSWAVFAEKGGMKGAIDFLPIDTIANVILACYKARDNVKAELYEITGIADIVRGNTDPNETAAAQQLKGQYANLRLGDRQQEVQRFCRDAIRIMAEVIAQHFTLETLRKISGVQLFTDLEKKIYSPQPPMVPGQAPVPPLAPPPKHIDAGDMQEMMTGPSWEDVMQLLRDEPGRGFRIDIETDSTIKADQEAEKGARIEFLRAAGGFLQQAVQAGSQQPELVPVLGQMLMFGIRAFPVGKELEQTFTNAIAKMEATAANPQQKPDPAVMKIQAEQQANQQKLQSEQQLEQARMVADQKIAQQKMQMDEALKTQEMQLKMHELQVKAQMEQHQQQMEAQRAQQQAEMESRLEQMKAAAQMQTDTIIAHIKAAAQIEAARVTATVSDGSEAEDREASGE